MKANLIMYIHMLYIYFEVFWAEKKRVSKSIGGSLWSKGYADNIFRFDSDEKIKPKDKREDETNVK